MQSSLQRKGSPAPGQTRPNALGKGEIRSLTGLRGCAAVIVMLYHFSLSVPPGTLVLQRVLENGYLCVDLFFVLSGFVMAYSQSRLFATGYRVRTHILFLFSRLARIYPLYAVITIESFCLLVWRSTGVENHAYGQTLLLNLGLVQAWGLAPSLEGAAWSISTEWAAYLLFPLLLTVTILCSRRMAWCSAMLCLGATCAIALSPFEVGFPGQGRSGLLDVYSSATALPLLRCVAEFTVGMLAYRVACHYAGRCQRWAGSLAAATLAAIVAGLWWSGLDVVVVGLLAVLIVALVPQVGAVARVLGGAVPYRLGQWSYSIYLIHDKFSHPVGIAREWLAARIPAASEVTIVLASLLVIALGGVTHHVVEWPLRAMMLGWLRRFRPVADRTETIKGGVADGGGAMTPVTSVLP